jgi:hypothetical protein
VKVSARVHRVDGVGRFTFTSPPEQQERESVIRKIRFFQTRRGPYPDKKVVRTPPPLLKSWRKSTIFTPDIAGYSESKERGSDGVKAIKRAGAAGAPDPQCLQAARQRMPAGCRYDPPAINRT